jgi:hypothetical protein
MLLIIPLHLRLTRIQVAYTRTRNSYKSLVNIFNVSGGGITKTNHHRSTGPVVWRPSTSPRSKNVLEWYELSSLTCTEQHRTIVCAYPLVTAHVLQNEVVTGMGNTFVNSITSGSCSSDCVKSDS